jgi:hypothetical protein
MLNMNNLNPHVKEVMKKLGVIKSFKITGVKTQKIEEKEDSKKTFFQDATTPKKSLFSIFKKPKKKKIKISTAATENYKAGSSETIKKETGNIITENKKIERSSLKTLNSDNLIFNSIDT